MNNKSRCKVEDVERLREILQELIDKYGHEVIKDFYKANLKIRNELMCSYFPISLVYRISLFRQFDAEYSKLSTKQISIAEGIAERRTYNLRREFWNRKKVINKGQQ